MIVVALLDPSLTHISLASHLWDIGKQFSPRCDGANRGVPSAANLFAQRSFIKKIEIEILKHTSPDVPKNKSGIT